MILAAATFIPSGRQNIGYAAGGIQDTVRLGWVPAASPGFRTVSLLAPGLSAVIRRDHGMDKSIMQDLFHKEISVWVRRTPDHDPFMVVILIGWTPPVPWSPARASLFRAPVCHYPPGNFYQPEGTDGGVDQQQIH